jgi:Tfp pilus assembly protein PilV
MRKQKPDCKGIHEARLPGAGRRKFSRTSQAVAGLTLIEILMSLLVTGIGILGVVALLPIAFVRAVQATNLTNGTILRYNAESMIDVNQQFLLRWQPNQTYSTTTTNYLVAEGAAGATNGDLIINPNSPNIGFQCTTAGTSGLAAPTWNTTVGATTTDGTCVWTCLAIPAAPPASPIGFPPLRFVIDPLGWYALGTLQTNLGNNNGTVDANAIPRFSGEIPNAVAASYQAYLPDSWNGIVKAPVSAYTANTATLMNNADLSGVGFSNLSTFAAAPSPYIVSRVVMTDSTGKISQTRLVTGTNVATTTISWSTNDPIVGNFIPANVRVESQEQRYTWLLTVIPSSGGGTSNVQVTIFFNRSPVVSDEQVVQESTPNADGVTTPFHFTYTPGNKPFAKKGSFLFDCYFGRWYRITNIANDTGSAFDIFVDQPRQAADMLVSNTFGAVFMKGVVDVYTLPLK